jgi:hypothetical protein
MVTNDRPMIAMPILSTPDKKVFLPIRRDYLQTLQFWLCS